VHALADVLALFLPVGLAIAGVRLSLGADMLASLAAATLAVSCLGFCAARRSRRAARTAAETARRVVEADRVRAALLATLGHDLRSPLAAAKAAVSGLRSAGLPLTADDRGELLAAADESLDQLARLAADLLDMSRAQAGKLSVFPRPATLEDIIERAIDDVAPRSVAVRVPPGLPEVMADPELMGRVVVNLARNALRYSPPGSPPLLTARAHGGWVELRVIDRGPGIPAAERDRAFLPFQRLGDNSTSPGVGLGLALSRSLTEAMGGTLKPDETPGGGLTMVISLPAARMMARAARSLPASIRRGHAGCGATSAGGHDRWPVHRGPVARQAASQAAKRRQFRKHWISRSTASSANAVTISVITAVRTAAKTSPLRCGGPVTRPEAFSHTVTAVPAAAPAGAGTSPVWTEPPVLSHRARTHAWAPQAAAAGAVGAMAGWSRTAWTACGCTLVPPPCA
jgi:signal transduction histidine kinase